MITILVLQYITFKCVIFFSGGEHMRKLIVNTAACKEKKARERKKSKIEQSVSEQLNDYHNQDYNHIYRSKKYSHIIYIHNEYMFKII